MEVVAHGGLIVVENRVGIVGSKLRCLWGK